ncbi:MAG: hypothetical protein V7607_1722 [Solirubrobacteraceae bacterium]
MAWDEASVSHWLRPTGERTGDDADRVDPEGWLGVEVRHLVALLAIDRERSFRRAAERLGYVQSAISQQIAQLERIVGARLVERGRGNQPVTLTAQGVLMCEHARRVLSTLRAAQADLFADAGAAGDVRVGVYGAIAERLVPQLLTLLRRRSRSPRVEVIETLSDAELFPLVGRGELDGAFAELPLMAGAFEATKLLVDPPMLVVNADEPLAHAARPPTLQQIAAMPVLCDPRWRMLPRIEAEFAAHGLSLRRELHPSSARAIRAFLANGLGSAAILPRLAVDPDSPETVAIPLDHLLPSRTLVFYWNAQRSRTDAIREIGAAAASVSEQIALEGGRPVLAA